ncbi:MAG TPA: sugar transferase [Acidimicrobiales bacterium]|nr:sugar transferase [Acidimicrobiales bacterium]
MHVAVEALERALALAPPPAPVRSRRLARAAVAVADGTVVALCAWLGGAPVLAATAAWTIALARYGLRRSRVVASPRVELVRLVHAVAAGAAGVAVGTYALDRPLPRPTLAATTGLVLVALAVERLAARHVFRALRRRGRLLRPVAVVGTGAEAVALATAFRDDPALGYRLAAFVGDAPPPDAGFDGTPVVPRHGKVVEGLQLVGAEGVVVATTDVDPATCNRLVRRLGDAGIHVELSTGLADVDSRRLTVRPLGRFTVVAVDPVARGGRPVAAKRAFDLVVAGAVLVAVAPLLVLVALAVKLDSPGPVLYRQERVGRRGRRFTMLKFRSMVADAEAQQAALAAANEADGPLFKVRHDPRVTRVGRVLRRLSLDELPQLVNVLRGEMSLVGPRPALPSEVVQWEPELFDRLRVLPGITGLWQVRGRSEARFADYRRWDLYYADNWSLGHDLAIVIRTIPAVLSRRGAY